MFPRKRKKKP